MKKILSPGEVYLLAIKIAKDIHDFWPAHPPRVYAIPRGGIPAMYAVLAASQNQFAIVDQPHLADLFLDDIIDSGSTMEEWCDQYPGKPFFALIDKKDPACPYREDWVVFPWESNNERSADDTIVGTITNRIKASGDKYFANDNISAHIHGELEIAELQEELEERAEHFLRGLIIDIENDHNTKDTAIRMAKMYMHEIFRGRFYPAPDITKFPNVKELDELVFTGPISIRSMCSHHMVPIFGKCWIGVIPGKEVFGLSKFNRIVQWFASRPQIQEEMVVQIADQLESELNPQGLAVIVEASHMCMTLRGVKESQDAKMTTSVMRGAFRIKPEARAEFMTLVAKG